MTLTILPLSATDKHLPPHVNIEGYCQAKIYNRCSAEPDPWNRIDCDTRRVMLSIRISRWEPALRWHVLRIILSKAGTLIFTK